MRILVAEDERITRSSLKRQLESWGHEVTDAEDGQQAWKCFGGAAYDIVITDWEMPHLSGLELVQQIHQAASTGYVYVIMLTSRSDKADLVKGIEAGADDFVSKPFDREELRVRLLAGERIVKLERALNAQNAELRLANERIRHGLRAAARVQRAMLPKQNILTPSVRTAWSYVPTDELAGDAIGLHLIEDRYLVSYVVDVSGHGVPAALLSVNAMRYLEPLPETVSLLRDMTMASGFGTVRLPSQIATELNRRFRSEDCDNRFLTMVMTVLDTHTGRLVVSCAGHPSPLIFRNSEVVPLPDHGGFPIAISDAAEYDDAFIDLLPGDRLLLFSDGLLEQTQPNGIEQFCQNQLRSVLKNNARYTPEEWVKRVIDELSAWAGATAFTDDVSLVVIEWLGKAASNAPAS
jgi:sigma-B regulation protein RsbU (phosphoserine phosphatase)